MATRKENEVKKWLESLTPRERKRILAKLAATLPEKPTRKVFTLDKLLAWKETKGIKCPYHKTSNQEYVKYGIRRGVQWYKCKKCGRTFSPLTNTFLGRSKKDLQVWKKHLRCMDDYLPVRKSAIRCKIHRNTAFVWRHKVLDALKPLYEAQRFKGIVELDDTFLRQSYKGGLPQSRKARKRGKGDKQGRSGITRDHVCVTCIVDRTPAGDRKHAYCKISTRGIPSGNAIDQAVGNKISPKATVCTDRASAYTKLAEMRKFTHIQLPNTRAKKGEYHILNVNSFHSGLKDHFLPRFRGVSTRYLNNYLIWHNYIYVKKKSRIALLKMCIKNPIDTKWTNVSDRQARPPVIH